MFSKGERIICINNHLDGGRLILGKIYIVFEYITQDEDDSEDEDHVVLANGDSDSLHNGWFASRFESLKEYRKKKLKKINVQ